jgi:hypothetical protein
MKKLKQMDNIKFAFSISGNTSALTLSDPNLKGVGMGAIE